MKPQPTSVIIEFLPKPTDDDFGRPYRVSKPHKGGETVFFCRHVADVVSRVRKLLREERKRR